MDELIFLSDIVARVMPVSSDPHVIVESPEHFDSALKFRFQVIEYLKGSGESELAVIVPWDGFDPIPDRRSAEVFAELMVDGRDRRWENREAVVFLRRSHTADQTTDPTGPMTYRFTGPTEYPVDVFQYEITSDYNRAWLPATDPSGVAGAVGSSEPAYFTEAPSAQSQGAAGFSSAGVPSIPLSEINRQIEWHKDLLYDGRDILGYADCLKHQFRFEAEIQAGRIFQRTLNERRIESGQPAGHRLWPVPAQYSEDPVYGKWWITGPDAHLFTSNIIEDPDDDPATGYAWEHVTTRPLPGGVYKVFYNDQPAAWVPCDYNPKWNQDLIEVVVTVMSPVGTVYEAFFDPVEIGASVGADVENGVLEPASFTLEGIGSVNINRIEWKSGRVEIQLDSHSARALSDHHMDFTALDGSVQLRLDFDNATEVERAGIRALSWGVCTQPWESGDLLMLRLSESKPDLTGVTSPNEQCPTDGNRFPVFVSSSYTFEIPETATTTAFVGRVMAVDPDDGGTVSYSILSGTEYGRFAIDGDTGEITVTGELDHETTWSYTLTVEASDGSGGVVRAAVRVLVIDVVELPDAPRNLAATSTHDSVTLTWGASDDPRVTGYNVYWGEAGQDTDVFVFESYGAATTMYVNRAETEPGTKYIYCVSFFNDEATGDRSCISVTTLAAP